MINTSSSSPATTTNNNNVPDVRMSKSLLINNHHTIPVDELMEEIINMESPWVVTPKAPTKCPLFCCFYAEFDIKKGPVIRYQCPKNFMNRDINHNLTTPDIHKILAQTFQELAKQHSATTLSSSTADDIHSNTTFKNSAERSKDEGNGLLVEGNESFHRVIPHPMDDDDKSKDPNSLSEMHNEPSVHKEEKHGNDDNDDDDNDDDDINKICDGGQSIFDSTSEYIITGSELTGKVITLSTHDIHIMTRPTQIANEQYERNSLLFSVGFVLRRAADPRPFRPLISKLAMTLRSMEIESGVLSLPPQKPSKIQQLLEKVLIAMNSPRWECNLVLDTSTFLNLKLFQPPKPAASPVHEYEVPILLRWDVQLQIYEWDLAINWVILHIDGITNARQISIKAEVDLEMVLACLRVLKHHGVIHIVDMFMYSNRYEFTAKAAAMLAGKEEKLLQDAVHFAIKRPTIHVPSSTNNLVAAAGTSSTGAGSTISGASDTGNSPRAGSPLFPTSNLVGTSSSSYPSRTLNFLAAGSSQRSSNFRFPMNAAGHSLEHEVVYLGRQQQEEDRKQLQTALAELYCSCNRNVSFGDLWLALTTETSVTVHGEGSTDGNETFHPSKRNLQTAINRSNTTTEHDISEHVDTIVNSPLEASLLESMKYNRTGALGVYGSQNASNNNTSSTKSSSSPIWRSIFKDFDHRRFVTFGVVYGLLIRVHSFPIFTGSSFPEKRIHSQDSIVSMLNSSSSASFRQPINFRHEMIEEKNFQLAKTISSAMDGSRCDDQLVCKYELPINKLVSLVEKYSGKKVVYVLATSK